MTCVIDVYNEFLHDWRNSQHSAYNIGNFSLEFRTSIFVGNKREDIKCNDYIIGSAKMLSRLFRIKFQEYVVTYYFIALYVYESSTEISQTHVILLPLFNRLFKKISLLVRNFLHKRIHLLFPVIYLLKATDIVLLNLKHFDKDQCIWLKVKK